MQSKLMLAATLLMFAATALMIARNEEFIFRDRGELTVAPDPNGPDTIVFTWRNKVEAPMARRFEDAYAEWKGKGRRILIDLHSPGGYLEEGEKVIRIIEEMKRTHIVDTQVGARRACYSMCVPIYLQGEERFAAPNARFMFHEPSTVDFYTGDKVERPQFERDYISRRYFDRYFGASPMDPEWRDKLAAEWKGKDLYYTARELVDQHSNIVTELE